MQMQQRATVSSRAAAEEDHCVIDVEEPPQDEEFRKRKMDHLVSYSDSVDLPAYSGGISKKEILRERLASKCIHSIPVIVLFCFFALWWFSSTENLVIKDGRIVETHYGMRMSELPLSFNGTHVELASLASSTSPVTSASHNLTETHLVVKSKKKPKKEDKSKKKPKKEVKLKSF